MFKLFTLIAFLLLTQSISAQTIKLGMSAPLDGPTKALGINLRLGAMQYFKNYNETLDGIKNPIELISYDDGYEPSRTIENTKQLINHDKVFALFNYVGTPTTKAITPLIYKHNIPFLTPYTGAEFLRTPHNPQILNIRASYYDEAEMQVAYLLKKKTAKKITLFIQADEFGIAASEGYIKALTKRGITDITQVRYKRNTENVTRAVDRIMMSKPDLIFCIGTYAPIGKLINKLRNNKITTPISTLSFAGATALSDTLKYFDNIYMTTVVNNPKTSMLPIVQSYREAMQGLPLSHESLEGYINAATFIGLLNKVGKNLTSASFIKAINTSVININGHIIQLNSHANDSVKANNLVKSLPPILNKITKQGVIEIH